MAQNAVEILSRIDKVVSTIAKSIDANNKKEQERSTSALNKGDVSKIEVETKDGDPNITAIVNAMNLIPPLVKEFVGLSDKNIKSFTSTSTEIIKSLTDLFSFTSKREKDVQKLKVIADSFKVMIECVKMLPGLVLRAPLAYLGLKMTLPVFKAYIKIIKTLSKLNSRKVKKTAKNIKRLTSAARDIIKFITVAMIILPLSLALGALVSNGTALKLIGLGFLAITVAVFAIILLAMAVGIAGKFMKLFGVKKAIKNIMLFLMAMVVLVGVCLMFGMVVLSAPIVLLTGLATMLAVVTVMIVLMLGIALIGILFKTLGLASAIRFMIVLMMAMILITAAVLYLGSYVKRAGGVKNLVYGLLAVSAVIIGLTKLMKQIARAATVSRTRLWSIALMELICVLAIGIVFAAGELGKYAKKNVGNIIVGLSATYIVMRGILHIAKYANKIKGQTRRAFTSVGVIAALAALSMGILYVAIKIGQLLKGKYTETLLSITYAGLIVLAFGKLAQMATKIPKSKLIMGGLALAAIELLALGAIGVVYAMVKFEEAKQKANVSWGTLALDVAGMMLIILAWGALAVGVGAAVMALGLFLGLGLLGMAAISLLALGATKMMMSFLEYIKAKKKLNVSLEDIINDIKQIKTVIYAFTLLGAALGVATPLILIALPAMVIVVGFMHAIINAMRSMVELHNEFTKAGGSKIKDTLSKGIPDVLGCFTKKNFDIPMGVLEIAYLGLKYAALNMIMPAIMGAVEAISKIAQIGGLVDDQGRISPVLKIDEDTGAITYGEPVNVQQIATIVTETLKIFVKNMDYGLKDVVNMENASDIIDSFSKIVEPMTKFVQMLTKYVGETVGNVTTLTPVSVDEKGNIKKGAPVDVVQVAKAVAGAVTSFLNTLYSKDNLQNWSELIYGDRSGWEKLLGKKNKGAEAVEEVIGVFATIIDPIVKFADCISSIQGDASGKTLTKIIVDDKGNIKKGEAIDIETASKAIISGIDVFVKGIYASDKIETWKALAADGGESFKTVLDCVSSFGKVLESLSSDKIKDNAIINNIAAGTTAMDLIFNMPTYNASNLNSLAQPLRSLTALMADWSNTSKLNADNISKVADSFNKIVTISAKDNLNVAANKLDRLTASMKKTSESLQDFDKIFVMERENRNKSFGDFIDGLDNMIDKFKLIDEIVSKVKGAVGGVFNGDVLKGLSSIGSGNGRNAYGDPHWEQYAKKQNSEIDNNAAQTSNTTVTNKTVGGGSSASESMITAAILKALRTIKITEEENRNGLFGLGTVTQIKIS